MAASKRPGEDFTHPDQKACGNPLKTERTSPTRRGLHPSGEDFIHSGSASASSPVRAYVSSALLSARRVQRSPPQRFGGPGFRPQRPCAYGSSVAKLCVSARSPAFTEAAREADVVQLVRNTPATISAIAPVPALRWSIMMSRPSSRPASGPHRTACQSRLQYTYSATYMTLLIAVKKVVAKWGTASNGLAVIHIMATPAAREAMATMLWPRVSATPAGWPEKTAASAR
mmetsp:Transcript_43961/g.113583  ORF Transcript_43961/g.113583 Transcript_43961/m.113583 type:complete len:229 (+) Transcript_43961:172-858(+)